MATTTSKLSGNAVKKNVGAQAPKATPAPTPQATPAPVQDKTSSVDPKGVSKFLESVRTNNVEDIVWAIVTAGEFDTLTNEAIEEAVQNVSNALGVVDMEHRTEIDNLSKELDAMREQLEGALAERDKANDRVKMLCGIIADM